MAAVGKRPREQDPTEVITIYDSDDVEYEAPPPKRHKSATPIELNSTLEPARTPRHPSRDRVPTTTPVVKKFTPSEDSTFRSPYKESPFKNIPEWTIGGRRRLIPEQPTRSVDSRSKSPTSSPEPRVNGVSPPKPLKRERITSRDGPVLQSGLRNGTSSGSPTPFSRSVNTDDEPTEEAVEKLKSFSLPSRVPETTSKHLIDDTIRAYAHTDARNGSAQKDGLPKLSSDLEIPMRPGPRRTSPPLRNQLSSIQKSPRIEIVIPSQSLLSQFQRPLSKTNIKAEKRALFKKLKKDTAIAKEDLEEVERLFGQTGFSGRFGTDIDEGRMKKAAPMKRREVNRDTIQLNWPAPPTTIPPAGMDFVHPKQQAKEVLTARFQDQYHPPLTFANNVNDRRLNGKFQFVDRYILRNGTRRANPISNRGCVCKGHCLPHSCECLTKIVDNDFGRGSQTEQIVTYTRRPDGIVVLDDQYIKNELMADAKHFEISECNEYCGCGDECWNRTVGKGRQVPLEIFTTEKCGFGVRSSSDLFKGQFIDLYLGELINEQELVRREDAKEENASSYIYSLDWFNSQTCLHVDGENFGTAMRFINHSCNPNARSFTVQDHKNDKHVYYLAFFAIRDIPAGTEIVIDYSPQEEGNIVEITAAEVLDGRALCYCEAPNCRRVLWRDAGRKRKKRKTGTND